MNITIGQLLAAAGIPPFSTDFFEALTKPEKIIVALCGVFVICILALFIEQTVYILWRYNTPRSVIFKSVQIIGVNPAMALVSLLGLCVPRAGVLCYFVGSGYIAVAMYNYLMLIDQYLGGKHGVMSLMRGVVVSTREPPLCCCCCCLPSVEVNGKTIRYLKMLVIQGVIIQPLLCFVAAVLWLDGQLTIGATDMDDASVYISLFMTVSTMVALYGLFLCYKSCRNILSELDIGQKFAAVQLVAIFFGVQSVLFTILAKKDVITQRGILLPMVRANAYNNMLLILELLILSIVVRFLYRHPHHEVRKVQSFTESGNDGNTSHLSKNISSNSLRNDVSLVNYFSNGTDDMDKVDEECSSSLREK